MERELRKVADVPTGSNGATLVMGGIIIDQTAPNQIMLMAPGGRRRVVPAFESEIIELKKNGPFLSVYREIPGMDRLGYMPDYFKYMTRESKAKDIIVKTELSDTKDPKKLYTIPHYNGKVPVDNYAEDYTLVVFSRNLPTDDYKVTPLFNRFMASVKDLGKDKNWKEIINASTTIVAHWDALRKLDGFCVTGVVPRQKAVKIIDIHDPNGKLTAVFISFVKMYAAKCNFEMVSTKPSLITKQLGANETGNFLITPGYRTGPKIVDVYQISQDGVIKQISTSQKNGNQDHLLLANGEHILAEKNDGKVWVYNSRQEFKDESGFVKIAVPINQEIMDTTVAFKLGVFEGTIIKAAMHNDVDQLFMIARDPDGNTRLISSGDGSNTFRVLAVKLLPMARDAVVHMQVRENIMVYSADKMIVVLDPTTGKVFDSTIVQDIDTTTVNIGIRSQNELWVRTLKGIRIYTWAKVTPKDAFLPPKPSGFMSRMMGGDDDAHSYFV